MGISVEAVTQLHNILSDEDVESTLHHLLKYTSVEQMSEVSMHLLMNMNADEIDQLFGFNVIHTSIPTSVKASSLKDYSVVMISGNVHPITHYFINQIDGKPALMLGLEGVPSLVEYSNIPTDGEHLVIRLTHANKPIALIPTPTKENEYV